MTSEQELRDELAERCAGHDLSPPAQRRLTELLNCGDADELIRVLRHLRRVAREGQEVSPVSSRTGAVFNAHFEALRDARAERVAAHRERITETAYRQGWRVARGESTVEDAARVIDRQAHRLDPEMEVPLFLVPWDEAEAIAAEAYASGVRDARQEVA